jgi:hypothetical protein
MIPPVFSKLVTVLFAWKRELRREENVMSVRVKDGPDPGLRNDCIGSRERLWAACVFYGP